MAGRDLLGALSDRIRGRALPEEQTEDLLTNVTQTQDEQMDFVEGQEQQETTVPSTLGGEFANINIADAGSPNNRATGGPGGDSTPARGADSVWANNNGTNPPAHTTSTPAEWSALLAAIEDLGDTVEDAAVMAREFAWQKDKMGDKKDREEFAQQLVAMQDLHIVAFMKKGSPFIHFGHSLSKFHTVGVAMQDIQGATVMFVGDRTMTRDPYAVSLPVQKPWGVVKKKVNTNAVAMRDHYDDEENYGKFWTPTTVVPADERELEVPMMCLLPRSLARQLLKLKKNKMIMPHEMREAIGDWLPTTELAGDEAQLVSDWSVLASHDDGNGNSPVAINVNAIINEDPTFHQWVRRRLDGTLGPRPGAGSPSRGTIQPGVPQAQGGLQSGMAQLPPNFAQQMGTALALGLRAGGGIGATQPTASSHQRVEVGPLYSEDQVCTILALSGTSKIEEMAMVWRKFQETKNTGARRHFIMKKLRQWSLDTNVPIDEGIYLDKKNIDDIAQLHLNPGQGIATFDSAEKGWSMLMCRPRSPAQIEKLKAKEKAELASAGNRNFQEEMELNQSDTPLYPAEDYHELKLNMGTITGLAAVFWTVKSPYYKHLLAAYNVMATPTVQAVRASFTPEICRRITWANIDEGRAYFAQVKTMEDFVNGQCVSYPVSFLDSILPDIRYVRPIQRPTFPRQWESRPSRQPAGGGGGGGGMQWNLPPNVPPPGGWEQQQPPPQQQQQPPDTTPNRYTSRLEDRNPIIVGMMAEYISKFGDRIYVSKILDYANKRTEDLPLIPGREQRVCWQHALGRCPFGKRCKYKWAHSLKPADMPDAWAQQVCQLIKPGVDYYVANTDPQHQANKRVKREQGGGVGGPPGRG